MSEYREECNHAKDVRRGVIEQREGRQKSKKAKPVTIEYRSQRTLYTDGHEAVEWGSWRKWQNYRSEDDAMKALPGLQSKYSFWQFRLKPQ